MQGSLPQTDFPPSQLPPPAALLPCTTTSTSALTHNPSPKSLSFSKHTLCTHCCPTFACFLFPSSPRTLPFACTRGDSGAGLGREAGGGGSGWRRMEDLQLAACVAFLCVPLAAALHTFALPVCLWQKKAGAWAGWAWLGLDRLLGRRWEACAFLPCLPHLSCLPTCLPAY